MWEGPRTKFHQKLEKMVVMSRTGSRCWTIKEKNKALVRVPLLGELVTVKRALYASMVGPIPEGVSLEADPKCVSGCLYPLHQVRVPSRTPGTRALDLFPVLTALHEEDRRQLREGREVDSLPRGVTARKVALAREMAGSNPTSDICLATGMRERDVHRSINGVYNKALGRDRRSEARERRDQEAEARRSMMDRAARAAAGSRDLASRISSMAVGGPPEVASLAFDSVAEVVSGRLAFLDAELASAVRDRDYDKVLSTTAKVRVLDSLRSRLASAPNDPGVRSEIEDFFREAAQDRHGQIDRLLDDLGSRTPTLGPVVPSPAPVQDGLFWPSETGGRPENPEDPKNPENSENFGAPGAGQVLPPPTPASAHGHGHGPTPTSTSTPLPTPTHVPPPPPPPPSAPAWARSNIVRYPLNLESRVQDHPTFAPMPGPVVDVLTVDDRDDEVESWLGQLRGM